jgi:hypothetical protein
LADVWTAADGALRQAITAAADSIDQQLQNNPEQQGESRDGRNRVFFIPPLGISFRVDAVGRIVTIAHVWCFQKREQ